MVRDLTRMRFDLGPNEASGLETLRNQRVLADRGWDAGFWAVLDDVDVHQAIGVIGHRRDAPLHEGFLSSGVAFVGLRWPVTATGGRWSSRSTATSTAARTASWTSRSSGRSPTFPASRVSPPSSGTTFYVADEDEGADVRFTRFVVAEDD